MTHTQGKELLRAIMEESSAPNPPGHRFAHGSSSLISQSVAKK